MQHLNAKIDVLESTSSQDAAGRLSVTWAVKTWMSDVPCRINWSAGTEKIMFDQETHIRDAKLYLHVLDIAVADIIEYDSIYYDIVDVINPDNANKFMRLDVKKRMADVELS